MLGERWHASQTAVWPHLVVVGLPERDLSSGLRQSLEPVLVQALVAEVVGDGQAFDVPTTGQAVADEVHAPDLVKGSRLMQRHAFEL